MVRNGDTVPCKPFPEVTIQKLATLSYHNRFYTMTGASKLGHEGKISYVLKYAKSINSELGYKLCKNDVIGFGAAKYLVKDINCSPFLNESNTTLDESKASVTHPFPLDLMELSKDDSCRICRNESNTASNPLLSICKCAGSIRYIHADCMRAWYKSKLTVSRGEFTTTYYIKGLECELCKVPFPLTINNEGQSINLIDIEIPKTDPYIVLESINDNSNLKSVHVIKAHGKLANITLVKLPLI